MVFSLIQILELIMLHLEWSCFRASTAIRSTSHQIEIQNILRTTDGFPSGYVSRFTHRFEPDKSVLISSRRLV